MWFYSLQNVNTWQKYTNIRIGSGHACFMNSKAHVPQWIANIIFLLINPILNLIFSSSKFSWKVDQLFESSAQKKKKKKDEIIKNK